MKIFFSEVKHLYPNCKYEDGIPLLHPLSEMTDDKPYEDFKFCGRFGFGQMQLKSIAHTDDNPDNNTDGYAVRHYTFAPLTLLYLTQNNFDLFELIKSGQAKSIKRTYTHE